MFKKYKSTIDLKKIKLYLLLFLVIAAQLIIITYTFSQRDGYHSDEGYSYQRANAFYMPDILYDSDWNSNLNQWIDTQKLMGYYTVQEGQQFAYDSVIYNVAYDASNSPLYYEILHTICSFFPDQFSWWFAYSINVIAFICTLVGLFFLCKELNPSLVFAFSTCIFYGFSVAASNCFIYLRMYAMLTALAVWLAFLHCRLYNLKFEKQKKYLFALFLINVIGGLTQYYFMILMLAFAIPFFIYLVFSKQLKTGMIYGITMFVSVIIAFALFPDAINDMLNSGNVYTNKMPFIWCFKYCLNVLFTQSVGIRLYFPTPLFFAVINVVLLVAVILGCAVLFLFRKDAWFISLKESYKSAFKNFIIGIPDKVRKINLMPMILIFVVIFTTIAVSLFSNIYMMGEFSDRYLFYLMPYITILVGYIVFWIINSFFTNRIIRMASWILVLSVAFLANKTQNDAHYMFYRESDSESILATTANSDVIIVSNQPWHLIWYVTNLRNSNSIYIMNASTVTSSLEQINQKKDICESVYVILENRNYAYSDDVKTSIEESLEKRGLNVDSANGEIAVDGAMGVPLYDYTLEDAVDYLATANWATESSFVRAENSFCGTLEIYKLK